METSPHKEIANLIAKSQRILLVSRGGKNGDVIASMIGLGQWLHNQGKHIEMLAYEQPDARFSFLKNLERIKTDSAKKTNERFTIIVNAEHVKPASLSYETRGNELHIQITPKNGSFSAKDVRFETPDFDTDLVITLGLADLDDLGGLYERNTQLFFSKTVVNIDNQAANEFFGQVNLVDVKTTSVSEIISALTEELAPNAIDADVATNLLTGMIYKTNSFQIVNTSPKTFTIAAQLVARGADQQEIMKHLYKTKPLEVLKLWGRVLARIQSMPEKKALWSILTQADFEKTQTTPDHLTHVLDELDKTTENRDIVVILYEEAGRIKGLVRVRKHSSAIHMAEKFSGGLGNEHEAYFEIRDKDFAQAEQLLVDHLKSL